MKGAKKLPQTLLKELRKPVAGLSASFDLTQAGIQLVNGSYQKSGVNQFRRTDSIGRVFEFSLNEQNQDEMLLRMVEPTTIHYYSCDINTGEWDCIGGIEPTPIVNVSSQFSSKQSEVKDDCKIDQSSLSQSPTERVYYLDTYLCDYDEGRVVSVEPSGKSDGQYRLLLDKTIFHAQGGGQPFDAGEIRVPSMDLNLSVQGVFDSEDKQNVQIMVTFDGDDLVSALPIGTLVEQRVDRPLRELLARIHSAGHLIDIGMNCAMAELKQKGVDKSESLSLKPSKGLHFTQGSYVEYIGNCVPELRPLLKESLIKFCDLLIAAALPSQISFTEDNVRRLGWMLEGVSKAKIDGISEDLLKMVEEYGMDVSECNCGGTHVDNSSRVKGITIKSFKKKGKNFRVSYSVA